MSKMDGLRAMREARYEQANPRPKQPPAGDIPAEGVCGHRAIGGRTCTREKGHEAKSHRYS